jgi:DNA repair protein SbcD/Mre11
MFTFLHAADVHLGSPLRGLVRYEGAPVERIREATARSFENLVRLAVEEDVAFVIVAGDLFDGQWEDMAVGLRTARQLRQLAQAGIPVFFIRGNHDAQSKVRSSVALPPEAVRELSVRAAETVRDRRLEAFGVVLHGRGFERPDVPDDLAAAYPEAVPGCFNIGILHTSLAGEDRQHDRYAPTSEQTLLAKGYDYWALGHVHRRRVIRAEDPFIGYSGNTQGRHVNEDEPKGCLLAAVEDGRLAGPPELRETDVVRWHRMSVALEAGDALGDACERIRERLAACRETDGERLSAVRIELSGACRAHREMLQYEGDAREPIYDVANDVDDVWIENVVFDTMPPLDLARLREGRDLLGELLREFENLGRQEQAGPLAAVAGRALAGLKERAAAELREAGVDLDSPEAQRHWLRQAESLLAAQLAQHQEDS